MGSYSQAYHIFEIFAMKETIEIKAHLDDRLQKCAIALFCISPRSSYCSEGHLL